MREPPLGVDLGHWHRRDAVLTAHRVLGDGRPVGELLELARWIYGHGSSAALESEPAPPPIALVRPSAVTPNPGPNWNTTEAAAYLNRPVGTLRQWRHKGIGPPSFKVRGLVTYRRSEVERWLAEQEHAERDQA